MSFESVNYPGHYLRHNFGRIKLHMFDGSPQFRQDASFNIRPGLAAPGSTPYANWVSFDSVNYPGAFLRHKNFELWVEYDTGGTFKADATFLIR